MQSIDLLVTCFNRLPGIGIKSAQRLAYHVINMPDADVSALAEALLLVKQRVHFCPVCGNYTEETLCDICSNPKRSADTLCVVKDARDVSFMERMREYNGQYHVLGGVLSPLDGIGPDKLNIDSLIDRVKNNSVKEVIIATNPDVEGDATASYIAKLLHDLPVRVTRIAHGIPIGGNLEFVDELTLFKAMQNRREI